MTPEELADIKQTLGKLIKARHEQTNGYARPMIDKADDAMVRSIVADHLGRPVPFKSSGVIDNTPSPTRGWIEPKPLAGSVPGLQQLDAVARGFEARDREQALADMIRNRRELGSK